MTLHQKFPKNFLWGTATSSYQIEGAVNEGGRGESIWDRFSHTPAKVANGENGDVANDHYRRWPDDIQMMKDMGVSTYRFSMAWPRILPQGTGEINEEGIDFYSRLVDGLLEAGITPMATLYHWDMPQTLQDKGGWPSREIVPAFVNYTDIITRALGDRVKMWATHNEPWVIAWLGYYNGEHAPGHKDLNEMLPAAHHLLVSHGQAVPVIRANVPDAEVGIVLNLSPKYPASPSYHDRSASFRDDGTANRWYLDPLAGRGYPADIVEHFDAPMDFVQEGDLKTMAAPIDYLGINYYSRGIVRNHDVPTEDNLPVEVNKGETTEMGWEIYPEGLFDLLMRLHYDYKFPKYFITENGAAMPDEITTDGQVHDPRRIEYYKMHFEQAARAIEHGVPLAGYYAWSLMDNFEWAYGYAKRFGMVYVDYETQKRTMKDSALWYQDFLGEFERYSKS